jgi:hypothetical protein
MAIRSTANGDIGPGTCHLVTSHGINPATTQGPARKKTALATAAADLRMTGPYA